MNRKSRCPKCGDKRRRVIQTGHMSVTVECVGCGHRIEVTDHDAERILARPFPHGWRWPSVTASNESESGEGQ